MIFDSRYDSDRARECRTAINRQLTNDLDRCLVAASKPLAVEVQAATETVRRVVVEERVCPELFLWQQALLQAIREPNVASAKTCLEALRDVAAPSQADDAAISLRSITRGTAMTRALEEISLQELFTDGVLTKPGLTVAEIRFEEAEEDRFRKWVDEAFELAALASPEISAEVRTLISEVQYYDGPGPSLSSTRTFGTVFMALPPEDYTPVHYVLEHLTHEASHHMLFAMMAVDPLIAEDSDEARFMSPVRPDPRPLYGIFHQAFVVARLVALWRALLEEGEGWALDKLRFDTGRFDGTIPVLDQHATLTEAGQALLDSCRSTVAENRPKD